MELKEELWQSDHPVVKSLKEIPAIIMSGDKRCKQVAATCISLKKLFRREEMDRHHADCLILYQIALNILNIMEELNSRHIFPGLYDLGDFYVDLSSGCQVWLLHPERFQLLDFEQEYDWYPEDERIFGDRILFDEESQSLADVRLIYKVLVGSAKGNVRIPPREDRADYSCLFYKTLPPELVEIFSREEGISHHHLRSLLTEAVVMERESDRAVRIRKNKQLEEVSGTDIYTLFVLLRTETTHSGRISRLLYKEQDRLELETGYLGSKSYQGFVYGDGSAMVREFYSYPEGFRIQCRQQIKDYSAGEAMIIACEVMENTIDKETESMKESPEFRICLLTDGRLKNDLVFRFALGKLGQLKEAGCRIRFVCEPGYNCEACEKLSSLCEQ